MSGTLLGETFDIHAGGLDLIFPHHENEIAQSRSAFGHAIMAKYWMHNGFLNISGEKMSKSLGNFFTVHELLDQYPGEAIRLLLLSAHYRQPLDFTHEGLVQAKATLDRWYGVLRGKRCESANAMCRQSVEDALSDDLNTPLAISAIHQLDDPAALNAGANALGLLQQDADAWFRWTPSRQRGSDGGRDRGGDRRPSGGAQGPRLQGVRPHPRRPEGQGRDPRGRSQRHDLEEGLALLQQHALDGAAEVAFAVAEPRHARAQSNRARPRSRRRAGSTRRPARAPG